jgi:hypothetical protein
MLPPLNVTEEVVDMALSILVQALETSYVGTSQSAAVG